MHRLPKPLAINAYDDRATRELKQYLMDLTRFVEETAVTSGGGVLVRQSVAGTTLAPMPPALPTLPFGQRVYYNREFAARYLEIVAGTVSCTNGSGAVAKYDAAIQASKWYYVEVVVYAAGTAPSITGTVQVAASAPPYATAGAGQTTYKVIIGFTDADAGYTSQWPGGDVFIEEGTPAAVAGRNLDFMGTETGGNVVIQAGHVRIYDTTTAVTGLTLPLNADTEVWAHIVVTGSTTPSVAVTNILQSGAFPGVVQIAGGSVTVCRKIGYIDGGHWFQEHEGEVNDFTFLLHPAINAAYQYASHDYGWNVLTPKTTDGAVDVNGNQLFFDGSIGGLEVVGGAFKTINPAATVKRWGGTSNGIADKELFQNAAIGSTGGLDFGLIFDTSKVNVLPTRGLVQTASAGNADGTQIMVSFVKIKVLTGAAYSGNGIEFSTADVWVLRQVANTAITLTGTTCTST